MNDIARADDRKFANTLARGLGALSVFRASDDGLTHAQIAERTGLPKPTISRLTDTLCTLCYLSHGARSDRFRLGPAAIAMGSVATMAVSFVALASDAMQALADQTGTMALITVRDADRMMLARTWRPAAAASIWLEPGHRIPSYGSSSGQEVLATLNDAKFEGMNCAEKLHAFRRDGYDQLIAQGFTIAPAETRDSGSVNAVSVPYFAAEFGEPVAFSCGALPETLSDNRMKEEVGPLLRAQVRHLEARTGQAPALARCG